MICVLRGLALSAAAAPPEERPEVGDLLDLSLEDLLDVPTTTATKSASTARETPAIVTVLQGDDLRAAGYTSIAEALRTVPGLYDLYDRVSHNVGVRGVSGGARASGNILQVRIDDQAVPLRTTTGNLFGPELVPMAAIERVEILRGPASALYGADAFLGVVRIVTRDGRSLDGAEITGQAGWVQQSGAGGLGLALGGHGESVDVFVSAHGMRIDRSGQALPESSPVLDIEPSLDGATSRRDREQPLSLLAHASTGQEDRTGRFSIWTSIQQLDANGEFLDIAPMTHGTRVVTRNQHYRLSWRLEPLDALALDAWAAAFDTRPTDASRVDLGVEDQRLLPTEAATGSEAGAEARVLASDAVSLIAGGSWTRERHHIQSYDTLLLEDVLTAEGRILRPAGTIMPGERSGEVVKLSNAAGYAQVEARIGASLHATSGVRLDRHSVYGLQLSPRAGAVLAPPEQRWSLKLLYGSSFKAPSAQQLFGTSARDYDIRGNPDLAAQRAQTGEIGGTWDLGRRGALLADVFVTGIDGRVEYLQDGLWLKARNALSEVYVGGEVEGTLRIVDDLHLRLGLGVARSIVQTRAEGVYGPESYPAPYPDWQGSLVPIWTVGRIGLRVAPEVLLIGSRPASQSNTLELGEPYRLPPAVLTGLSLGLPDVYLFGTVPTSFALRGTDLLDTKPVDPGFSGVDYPGMGRTVWLTVTQRL